MWNSLGLLVTFLLAPAASVQWVPSLKVVSTSASRPPAISVDVSGECLRAPVDGPLLAGFVAPACPFCAGRRTLGFDARAGDLVRSPVSGRVHFLGAVAGSGYLTVIPTIDSSLLVTIGGVVPRPTVSGGQELLATPLIRGTLLHPGQAVGMATGPVGLSVRRRSPPALDTYLDPEPYLARWRIRARLVPLADQGQNDPPGRAAGARFGCRRTLNDGATDPPPR